MRFDEITTQSLLYDFYSALLTDRQRTAMELYHEENLSLAEIASEFGISRQGVHDALKNAQKSLEEYERKLGLVAKFDRSSQAIEKIENKIDQMLNEGNLSDEAFENLREIRRIIDELE